MEDNMNILNVLLKLFKSNYSDKKIDEGGLTMLKAQDLAKYIRTKCTLDGKPIRNLQLQKILYFVQGAFYYKFDHSIFDDTIRAWDYGPVIDNVYNMYKKYGSSTIQEVDINFESTFNRESEPEATRELVDIMVESLREIDPWELVRISHEDGTPWKSNYHIWWPAIESTQIENYFKGNDEIFKKLNVNFNKKPKGTDTESNESKIVLDFFNELNKIKKQTEE